MLRRPLRHRRRHAPTTCRIWRRNATRRGEKRGSRSDASNRERSPDRAFLNRGGETGIVRLPDNFAPSIAAVQPGNAGGAHETRLAEARRVFCHLRGRFIWQAGTTMNDLPQPRLHDRDAAFGPRSRDRAWLAAQAAATFRSPTAISSARELAAVFQGRAQVTRTAGRATRPRQRSKTRSPAWRTAWRRCASAPAWPRSARSWSRCCAPAITSSPARFCSAIPTACSQTAGDAGHRRQFVDATDARAVEAALTPATRLVFVETIANPRTQIADLARIGELCARATD